MGSITSFLAEFLAFESHSVGAALRSFSKNPTFAANAEKMLDLDARLKLVKRMAFVRNLDRAACDEIEDIEARAVQLAAKRDELLHTAEVAAELRKRHLLRSDRNVSPGLSRSERAILKTVWRPTVAEIDECRNQTTSIRKSLSAIVEHLEDAAQQT